MKILKSFIGMILVSLLAVGNCFALCDTIIDGKCYLTAGVITFRGQTQPSVSPSGSGRMYFDVTEGVFKCSEDGGAYGDCGGTGVGGDFVLIAGDTMTGDLNVPDEAYDATAWNGSTEVPTKNSVRDKIEAVSVTSPWTDGGAVTYLTSATDDMAIGGTTSAAPIFADESTEIFRANGGFTAGDGTDKSTTFMTIDLAAGDQNMAWDDLNGEIDISAPLNITCAAPSSSCMGFTVNTGGGNTSDDSFFINTGTEEPFISVLADTDTFEGVSSKAWDGDDTIFYFASTSVAVTGTNNFILGIQSADAQMGTFAAGDGTNYFTVGSNGAVELSGTANLTLPAASDIVFGGANDDGPFLANDGDVGTGAYDFGGATSLEIPNGTAPTVSTTGQIGVDTTDDQLKYQGASATRVIPYEQYKVNVRLETPTTSDDNVPIDNPKDAITLTSCYCRVQGGTSVTMHYSDGTNDGEDIVCDSDGQADDGSLTNNTFTARERMEFDTVAVSGSVNWVQFQCEGNVDAQ